MSLASLSDGRLVKLVAGGCHWVHGSATEMTAPLPLLSTAPVAACSALDPGLWPINGTVKLGGSSDFITNPICYAEKQPPMGPCGRRCVTILPLLFSVRALFWR